MSKLNVEKFLVPPDTRVKLKDYSTSRTEPFESKSEAEEKRRDDTLKLADWQAKLYAQNTHALLIILQGIDAAGKDSTIKHVMSGVNPTGCEVTSFKTPSTEELNHDYLWRHVKALPERGKIGIFNRSYYEEVLVVRVHPELLAHERIQPSKKRDKLWSARYQQINEFERYLVENGTEILKVFLHLSKKQQKARFLSRLEAADKNWKFEPSDVKERAFWDEYVEAFEDMLSHTSTEHAPWHVIPADHKWFTQVSVADIIIRKLASLDLRFPVMDAAHREALEAAKQILENES
jgi:PPK2 family polyphosphate:nucleotide phosphotransferase